MLEFDKHLKIIGVVGIPDSVEDIDSIRRDLNALQEGGIDGLLIENLGDTPSSYRGDTVVADFFRKTLEGIRAEISSKFGLCLLPHRPTYNTAVFQIAKDFGADFVWFDTLVDKVSPTYTPRRYEPLEINPNSRRILSQKTVPVFTEIQPRNFYRMLENKSIHQSAIEARRSGADSITVVRHDDCKEQTLDKVRAIVGPTYPLGITGKLDPTNVQQYIGRAQYAVIYGYFRERGTHDRRVNPLRVRNLMAMVK